MIARFQVLIPFKVFVEADLNQKVTPEEVDLGDLKAQIFPPYRSQLQLGDVSGESGILAGELISRLDPADPQPTEVGAQFDSGPAIIGDILRIDFLRPSFDRTEGTDDPPVALAFNLANSWIHRYRLLCRTAWAQPLSRNTVPWTLSLLNDDGNLIPTAPGKWRKRSSAVFEFKYSGLDVYGWNVIKSLPIDYRANPSDDLLLDAYALLPQVGPAIVLAYCSVETRISQALDRLASLTGLNPGLWSWLTDRGDSRKDPSTAEQLDVIASAMTGKSLKDESLWEGFSHLREVRNRFVHEGKATLGKQRVEVDSTKALELVRKAEQVIDWIEGLLPVPERRPRAESPNKLAVSRQIMQIPVQTTGEPGGESPETTQ